MFYDNIPEQNALIMKFFPRWGPGVWNFVSRGPIPGVELLIPTGT